MGVRQQLLQAIDSIYSRGPATEAAYTRLVLECFRTNDLHQARRLEAHMSLHLFEPQNTFLHNRLLHLFAKSGNLEDVHNLFDVMPKRDIISWNALLYAYSRSGSVEDMWEIFDTMPSRDSVSYNTAIACFAANGSSIKALELFSRMREVGVKPTEYTHVSTLQACSDLLDVRRGREIHGRIVVCGNMGVNVFIRNALTDMYAKCGEIDNARRLFDRTLHKTVVSWNSMISGYLKNGQPDKCIELFREMKFLGLKPDHVTFSSILSAYFQSGYAVEASNLFSEIDQKDKFCWTVMIVGYSQNGMEEDALVLFKEMLLQDARPDSVTISSVVACCAKLAFLFHGQVIHGKSIHMGIDGNLLVSSALVDMYCKSGVTNDAIVVFNMMPVRNLVSWNTMIWGCAQNGQDLEALNLYEKMFQENLKPDSATFIAVLSACSRAGLLVEGQRYFDSISKVHGMTPTLDHYACMIYLLGRCGCIVRAMNLIENMPHEPNHLIWSTLLSVCALKGDTEHGEMAARHLFELEPLNAGPYIMLSNMYAACGRWKEVAHVRSLMEKRNVKKFAAYSWIEVDNKVHKFVSDDRTHPDAKVVYKELKKMIRKLQEIGFTPNTELVLHDVGEDEKFESICFHSEKLALVFGLIKIPYVEKPIRIIKNIRVCGDCHLFMKFVSKTTGRTIILRDTNLFHHFINGNCSCKDEWII